MAQTQTFYDEILADEAELVFDAFGLEDSWHLGAQMRAAAVEQELPIVIGIVLGRQHVFRAALPGSSADNDGWLARKTAVALRYGRSSMGVGERFREQGRDFDTDSRLDTTQFAAHGGVFPVQVRGTGVVGAVGVSGLPQKDDHAFVVGRLRAYLTTRP
ncbi:MAG: heme-degrading domain-containing protein [Georgenia sp.]